MNNDNVRFFLLGIVIAVFVPQLVTVMCLKREGRSISADVDCGTDASNVKGKCVCSETNKYWNGTKCVWELGYTDGGCELGYEKDGSKCIPIKKMI